MTLFVQNFTTSQKDAKYSRTFCKRSTTKKEKWSTRVGSLFRDLKQLKSTVIR